MSVVTSPDTVPTASYDAKEHHNRGVVFARKGELAAAIAEFQAAIGLNPHASDTHRNLGLALAQSGDLVAAEAAYRRVTELKPNSPKALHDLANLLRANDRPADAIVAYTLALELQPDSAELHHDLGLAQADLEKPEAIESYRKAIELKPRFVEAHNNLGIMLEQRHEFEEAIACYREAIRLRPKSDSAYNNLGVALAAQRRHAESIAVYRQALAIQPQSAQTLNNLGNALRAEGQLVEAEQCLRKALQLKPDYAEAFNNLAITLVQSGQNVEALTLYKRAILLTPDYPEAHLNLALALLGVGNFEQGWTEYEWRWKGKDINARKFPQPRWDGSPLAERTILLHFEQGLGDTLQFLRYAARLKQQGARVVAFVQKPLTKLLSHCELIDEVVSAGQVLPKFDFHLPLMSLPGIFGTTVETVPCESSYIEADALLIDQWKERIARIDGFRVGIAWQGNPDYRGDRLRSIALHHFRRLAEIPGVQLVSLQKGLGTEQLAALGTSCRVHSLEPFDVDAGPFMDTAAIMKNLDLVISSDTAIVHLAGALGVPTWVALPLAADWRWLHNRADCPWYPSMRLFRQKRIADWESVFTTISDELSKEVAARNRSTPEISAEQKLDGERVYRRAVALTKEGKLAEAVAEFQHSIELYPYSADAHHNRGVVLGMQKQLMKAIECFRQALELRPQFGEAHSNLGLAYLENGETALAVEHLTMALRLGVSTADLHNNLGVAYMHKNLPQKAEAAYRRAVEIRPDYADAHQNLARAYLIQGKFAEGWVEYEWRWKIKTANARKLRKPRWTGVSLAGRTLLLHAEQGLGDTLQMIRYAAVARSLGGNVIVETPKALLPLLKNCPHVDQVIATGTALPNFDFHAPLMSLPGLLETTLSNVPATVPYLFADESLVESWRARLEKFAGYRVGIAWQGNQSYSGDRNRSITLEQFWPLGRLPYVDLISLQKGTGAEQLRALPHGVRVHSFGSELDERAGTFMDTAAIMRNLDVIITSDTAIAHLAGGLGVPVWVALPFAPDCRWLLDRDDSPWYPSMRLFRQSSHGKWSPVFEEIAAALRAAAKAKRTESIWRQQTPSCTGVSKEVNEASRWHSLGIASLQDGDIAEAVRCFHRAVQLRPDWTSGLHDLGAAYARDRRLDEAVRCFQRVLELDPNSVEALGNLGLAYVEMNQPQQAIRHLKRAISLRPKFVELYNHLGIAWTHLKRYDEAIDAYREALQLRPQYAEAWNNLGNAQRHSDQLEEAVESYRQAIQFRSDRAEPHNNLGIALSRLGRLDEAIDSYQESIRIRRDYSEAYNNLGVALTDGHREAEAIAAFENALLLTPQSADTHKNLSFSLLLSGDLSRGFLEYEWRLRTNPPVGKSSTSPPWDGSPLTGRRILLRAEQGLGDTIQFIRYCPLIKHLGATVLLECQGALKTLLQDFPGIDQIVTVGEDLPQHDCEAALLSAPCILGTTLATVPAETPYLRPAQQLVEVWRERMSNCHGMKIGIAWQGSRNYSNDAQRSIPLQQFSVLASLPHVTLFSLHANDPAVEQSADFPLVRFPDLDKASGRFMDTAALMTQLDLVVTSDTSLGHLAGALGVPVWVALCWENDWRWMRDRTDSPWYPTMRLFRQQTRGNWDTVFELIRAQIAATTAARFGTIN